MIFREKLDLDLLKCFNMKEFMQIHFFKLIFKDSYDSINFQNDNSKDLDI